MLPAFHTTGRHERWLDVESKTGFARLVDYFLGVASAAKDWGEKAAIRLPGTRDRVVTVFTNGLTQGGLKLNLDAQSICDLGYLSGTAAGRLLAQKFLLDPKRRNSSLIGTPGWLDHRWVRFNAYLAALKENLKGFSSSIQAGPAATGQPGTSSLRAQIAQAIAQPPLNFKDFYEPSLSPKQADALTKAVDAIEALEAALKADKVLQPYVPEPQPALQMRSRL